MPHDLTKMKNLIYRISICES